MNKKRLVAILAAATMLLGTVPVMAETSGEATEVTSAGTTTVTGDSTVNDYEKKTEIKVTLPTAKALDIIVDPHNLVGLASGQAVDAVSATGQGAILAADGALGVIKNKSNVDVKVSALFTLENAANATVPVDLKATQAAVEDGTKQAMFLAVVPSTQKAWDASTYKVTDQAIAVASAGTTVDFLLDAATYEIVNVNGSFVYQYKTSAENNFDATAFKMGGAVNKAADWYPLTDKLSVKAVFTVNVATASDVKAENGIHALASGSATTVDYTPVAGATETPATPCYVDYNSTSNWFWLAKDASTPFTAGATISGATVNGQAATATIDAAGYVLFKWDDMKTAHPTGPWAFTVTVDGVKYTATYTN